MSTMYLKPQRSKNWLESHVQQVLRMDLLLVLLLMVLIRHAGTTEKHYNETLAAQLMNRLLNRSDARIRPNIYGSPVGVSCDFYVASFGSINAIDMDFVIDVFFRQGWTDERLAFHKDENLPFMQDKPLIVSSKSMDRLWVPDLYFPNEKSAKYHEVMLTNKVMKIFGNGTVKYSARMTLKLACPMDLTHFPMDYQDCYIKVSSYSYTTDDVVLTWDDDTPVEIIAADELSLPQFELKHITTGTCAEKYKTGDYSCLMVVFHLRRQFGYYLLQAYIPSILIVILSWLSFWIHKDAVPARITLGVTTVLTMATQLSSSRGTTMTVSYAKAIDVWYAFCMIQVFSALLEYAIVNSLTRKEFKRNARKRAVKATNEDDESPSSGLNTHEVEMQSGCTARVKRPLVRRLTTNVKVMLNIKDDSLSSHKIDRVSRCLFPGTFALFNVLYWIYYTQRISYK